MRVCPHCAEELPDDARACTMCGKDPAVAPASTLRARIDDVTASASSPPERPRIETASTRIADPLEAVPQRYEGLERAAAQERPVPLVVWVSFTLALLSAAGAFLLPIAAGLVVSVAGHLTGAALGAVGRRAINDSGGRLRGSTAANAAIALNLVQLLLTLVALGPLLPTSLAG